MKKLILSAVAIYLLMPSYLTGQVTFQKSFIGSPIEKNEIVLTSDGGYAIVGRKTIRLNNAGDTIWTKSYLFGSSALTGGVQTLDGGYAISGYTNSAGIGLRDFFLIKADNFGNVMWAKAYGGLNHDETYSLFQTADSGFIIAGSTRSVFPGSVCDYLVRTDLNGDLLWAKAILGNDRASTVIQTSDGGFIVSGGITYKMDGSGNIQWAKRYDGPGSEVVNCIRQTADGGYILTGTTYNVDTTSVVAVFLFKIDAAGNLQWSHHFANYFTFGNAVEQTSDGGYIVTGSQGAPSSTSDVFLIKTNALGDTLWTRAFGGADSEGAWSVKQTTDDGYIVSASSHGLNYGIYVIKTDSLGNSGCNQLPTAFIEIDSSVTELTFTGDSINSGGIAEAFTAATSFNSTTVVPFCFANNTGINEIKESSAFHIYPNPSSGKFTFTTETRIKQGTIQLVNMNGITVYEQSIMNASTTEINLNNFTPGIYCARIVNDQNQSGFQKLVLIKE